MTEVTYYKFLYEKDGQIVSQSGDQTWEVGKKYTVKGKIKACSNGFHASENPKDALNNVPGNVVALVEVSGDSDNQSDKVCYRSMKIVKAHRWAKKDSVKLAVFAAELVINLYESEYPSGDRPRKAIAAAKAWIEEPNASSVSAAWAAAAAAAAAADAAKSVAKSAAYAVAYAAAWAATDAAYAATDASWAATDASYAATDASWAATNSDVLINEWMRNHIEGLEEIT